MGDPGINAYDERERRKRIVSSWSRRQISRRNSYTRKTRNPQLVPAVRFPPCSCFGGRRERLVARISWTVPFYCRPYPRAGSECYLQAESLSPLAVIVFIIISIVFFSRILRGGFPGSFGTFVSKERVLPIGVFLLSHPPRSASRSCRKRVRLTLARPIRGG